MKNLFLISSIVVLLINFIDLACSAEVASDAHYFSANGNSRASIEAEVGTVDLMAAVGEKSLALKNVKLKLSRDVWVFFVCEFDALPDEISSKQQDIIEGYLRLRLNGLSVFGSIQILKCWFDPKNGKYPDNYENFPKETFEKIDKIPDWAISFFNEGFPPKNEKLEYYMFRDHDLVWVMKASEDGCHFICGFDSRHFSQKEFHREFLREREKFKDERLSKAQAETIRARLMESWCVSWCSPFKVPLPGDSGSSHD